MKLLVSAHSPSSPSSEPSSCWARLRMWLCCGVLLPCMLLARCADDAADALSELAHVTNVHRLSQDVGASNRITSTSHTRLRTRYQLTSDQTDQGAAWCVMQLVGKAMRLDCILVSRWLGIHHHRHHQLGKRGKRRTSFHFSQTRRSRGARLPWAAAVYARARASAAAASA
jgi:hypothetical protein